MAAQLPTGSHPRHDFNQVHDLAGALSMLHAEEHLFTNGRASIVLVDEGGLKVQLMVLRRGATLAPHSAPGTMTVQVLEGELLFTAEGAKHSMVAGEIIPLRSGAEHAVEARRDSAFLITIARSTAG